MMGDQVRWTCPLCGKGALGPRRPRRENVVRWCLVCSKRTGKLVERSAAVVEREREAARARQRERAAAKRRSATRAKRRVEDARSQRMSMHGVDLERLADDGERFVRSLYPLPRGVRREIRRSTARDSTSGHAHERSVTVTLPPDWAGSAAEVVGDSLGVILHEYLHVALWGEHHSARYLTAERQLTEALTGRRVERYTDAADLASHRPYYNTRACKDTLIAWLEDGGRWPWRRAPIVATLDRREA